MAKIIAFSGSTRKDSYNQQLVSIAAAKATALGAEVTLVDLRDYPMPLFNEDEEAANGPPESADKLFELMKSHQGWLLACPEYNGSVTPLLKNTIDWMSRTREGEQRMAAYVGKVTTLMSASAGGLGGMRGLVHVRAILSGIGAIVLPNQVAVGGADKVLADGKITDAGTESRIDAAVAELINVTDKLT